MSAEVEYVTLPTGEVARIFETDERGIFFWSVKSPDDENDLSDTCYSRDHAVTIASGKSAARCMHPNPVVGFCVADAIALERADRHVYTQTLKRLLIASTGEPAAAFSVAGSTGTASSWIHVRGKTDRGRLWVAALFGDADGNASIPPTRGYRALYAARAAGIPTDGIECAEHGWD